MGKRRIICHLLSYCIHTAHFLNTVYFYLQLVLPILWLKALKSTIGQAEKPRQSKTAKKVGSLHSPPFSLWRVPWVSKTIMLGWSSIFALQLLMERCSIRLWAFLTHFFYEMELQFIFSGLTWPLGWVFLTAEISFGMLQLGSCYDQCGRSMMFRSGHYLLKRNRSWIH